MNDDEKKSFLVILKRLVNEVNNDKFMLMEYLSPVIDGCRAALQVNVEKVTELHSLSDEDVELYIDSTEGSLLNTTICFQLSDINEVHSFVFEDGEANAYDECLEPDIVFHGSASVFRQILDPDAKCSPAELLGKDYTVEGSDPSSIIEGLGLLCFPSLLRIARTGVDPSSLLVEDADSIILAAASELVTSMVKAWIDSSISQVR